MAFTLALAPTGACPASLGVWCFPQMPLFPPKLDRWPWLPPQRPTRMCDILPLVDGDILVQGLIELIEYSY
jgi:hypothetical protein